MTRRSRDKDAERTAIRAAAARLLAESGLRRDAVYGDHKDLVEEFQAQAKARSYTPDAVQKVAAENVVLKQKLKDAKAALAVEQERTSALVRVAAELSVELEQTRAELESAQHVPRLPGTSSPRLPPRRRR